MDSWTSHSPDCHVFSVLLLSCPGTTLSALIPQALHITCSILPDPERSVEAESTCCQPQNLCCPTVHCGVLSLLQLGSSALTGNCRPVRQTLCLFCNTGAGITSVLCRRCGLSWSCTFTRCSSLVYLSAFTNEINIFILALFTEVDVSITTIALYCYAAKEPC